MYSSPVVPLQSPWRRLDGGPVGWSGFSSRWGQATGPALLPSVAAVLAVVLLGLVSCAQVDESEVIVALVDTGVSEDPGVFGAYAIEQSTDGRSGEHGTMMLSVLLGVNDGDDSSDALPTGGLKVLSFDVGEEPTADELAASIDAAAESGADLISISMGVRRPKDVLERAVANAHEAGVVIVAAAGNVGAMRPDYPARYDDVVSVAAVDSAGEVWDGGSTTGVDTVALGVDVPVLLPDGTRRSETGTSIAAAVLSHEIVASLLSGEISRAADFQLASAP